MVVGDVKVQRLIHDVDDFGLLRGERQGRAARESTLAVLAVRMRNQQAVLDRSAPYDVVHLLNRFYYEVGEPILAAGGLISEYRDTGLIAYFGLDETKAREKCLAAVRAGLRIVLRIHSLGAYLRAHFGFDPEIGIGIHFGRAVVGSLGHPSQQFVSALGELNPIAFWLAGVQPLHPPCLLGTEEVVNLLEDELRFGEVVADSGARSLGPQRLGDPRPAPARRGADDPELVRRGAAAPPRSGRAFLPPAFPDRSGGRSSSSTTSTSSARATS